MQKVKLRLTIICLGLFVVCCHSAYSLAPKPSPVRLCVRAQYLSQIGVREKTGHNDGPMVEAYLKSCGLGKGYPWCAAFINWNLHKCGVHTETKTAWAGAWFKDPYVIYRRGLRKKWPKTPQSGDMCGYYFSRQPIISHIGFVDQWGEKITITVEGNTNGSGGREGDGVYRMRRLTRSIVMVANWID